MELEVSLYDFIDEQYRQNIPVLVCNVTPEEYNNMKEQLQWGGLNERIYDLCATKILGYNKCRYMITYNPFQKNMLISNYDFIIKQELMCLTLMVFIMIKTLVKSKMIYL